MSETERKKLLVDLEADYRRTETALAVAQADYEKSYAALWSYMNQAPDGTRPTLTFAPEITMH